MLQAISNADSALFHGSVFAIDWSIVGGLGFGTFDSSQHTLCVHLPFGGEHLPFGGESGGPGCLGVKKAVIVDVSTYSQLPYPKCTPLFRGKSLSRSQADAWYRVGRASKREGPT